MHLYCLYVLLKLDLQKGDSTDLTFVLTELLLKVLSSTLHWKMSKHYQCVLDFLLSYHI